MQAWPEKGRRLIAGSLLAASAIILFVSWGSATSSRLAQLSGNTLTESADFLAKSPLLEELPKPDEKPVLFANAAVSPLNGLWESIRSLTLLPYSFMNQLDRAADFAADKLR